MKCPVCTEVLTPHERQGVEIDSCPKCRGVWLDRGELDKIIQRASDYEQSSARRHQHDDDDDDDHHRQRGGGYAEPRRRSWWSELFD